MCGMEGGVSRSSSMSVSSVSAAAVPDPLVCKINQPERSVAPTVRSSSEALEIPSHTLAFVYGTLKRGFGNHWLMEELMEGSHAQFLGYGCTIRRFPLVCGPFQVPFLLPSLSPAGHHVRGELYQVDSFAIKRLDELEGVGKGHYERCPIDVRMTPSTEMGFPVHQDDDIHEDLRCDVSSSCILTEPLSSCRIYMDSSIKDESILEVSSEFSGYVRAEAYFACADYGLRMADCAQHIPCYTKKEASTYVPRKYRPPNRTFLEHVHAWIEEQRVVCT
ncbi:hypothetical protein KP509_12G027100 [Ceratopteris richardii]|nr:hypothetical protein KP509_12G027100 [Ceratopteris richardii]